MALAPLTSPSPCPLLPSSAVSKESHTPKPLYSLRYVILTFIILFRLFDYFTPCDVLLSLCLAFCLGPWFASGLRIVLSRHAWLPPCMLPELSVSIACELGCSDSCLESETAEHSAR